MELSPSAFEFSHLVLKYYNTKKPSKTEENKEQDVVEDFKKTEPVDPKTKYSMDYKKFEELTKENEEKSKTDDPFKDNPYLQQMGCSHDRRKAIFLLKKKILKQKKGARIV